MEIPKINPIQKSPVMSSKNNQSRQSQDQLQIEDGKKSTEKKLGDSIKTLNKMVEQSRIEINFKLHEKSGEYYVQMIDSKTDAVIREIPSKKVLDYFANLKEFLGLVVDKRI